MHFRPLRLIVGISAIILGVAVTLPAQQLAASPEDVPQFTLNDYHGNQVALQEFNGKVVLINFWATWCPPCIEEMPTFQALKESFHDKPFEVLAINMAEDRKAIGVFLERTGFTLDFPLLLDPGGVVADLYEVRTLPATLVIDRNGKYAFGGVGERDWNSPAVQQEFLPLFD